MKMTKRQHYVPQFYMKYWSRTENNNITYLDIYKKYIGYISPKTICCSQCQYEIGKIGKEYMCPNKFEDGYGKLETQISIMLNKLFPIMDDNCSSTLIFSSIEKELIRRFVITMYLRNPKYDINLFLNEAYNEKLQDIQKMLDIMFNNRVDTNIVQKIIRNIMISSDMKQCDGEMLGGILYRNLEKIIKSLYISILRSNNSFIFSDMPVIIERNSIYMPLSPKYAIIFGEKCVVKKPNRIVDISDEEAMKFNKRYLYKNYADPCEYLYSQNSKKGKLLLENIKKFL